MTLGLWLEKEHIDDVDPVVRYFNFDRPYFKQTERCETLSLKIHLTRFTEEQLERPCSVPTYRSKPFGLYLFPDERKWHPGKFLDVTKVRDFDFSDSRHLIVSWFQ